MLGEHINITLPFGNIEGLAFGKKSNPTILAIHGWLDNAASFQPLANHLATKYRVIALDLPGHGQSAHYPQGTNFNILDYTMNLIQIIHKLNPRPKILLGHSLGGALFTLVAGIIPDEITHLALIDSIGPFTLAPEKLPTHTKEAIFQFENIDKKRPPQYKTSKEAKIARLKATPMKESSLKLIIDRGLINHEGVFQWRTDKRLLLKSSFMLCEEQLNHFLKNITAKTYLIRATEGWPFPKEYLQKRIKHIKNLKLHEVKGNHYVHMEEPKMISDLLLQFF